MPASGFSNAAIKGLTEDRTRSLAHLDPKLLAPRAATTEEIWFQDKARVGQKNKITRRWARRATRPSAPKDQRTKSAYIFGAICPEHGKGAGLVLPFCNTETMTLHLAEISLAIAPGAHAVVLMDQAGWHTTGKHERNSRNGRGAAFPAAYPAAAG